MKNKNEDIKKIRETKKNKQKRRYKRDKVNSTHIKTTINGDKSKNEDDQCKYK